MLCFDPNNCSINIANISYNGILQVISDLFLANLSGTKDHMLMLSRAAHYIITQENSQTFLDIGGITQYCVTTHLNAFKNHHHYDHKL